MGPMVCAKPSTEAKRYLKRELFRRDGNGCCWCGKTLSYETATLEHLIPRSHPRSRNLLWNFRLACQPCNWARNIAPVPLRMFVGQCPEPNAILSVA